MAFRLRTVLEIADSILAIVKARSGVDDTEVGSVNRSLAEGSALQDADQYVQIGKLKELFNLFDAKGADLDERLADYGTQRLSATQAVGQVVFGDSAAETFSTTLSGSIGIGVSSLTLASVTGLAATGAVVVDRDVTGSRELLAYTAIVGTTLTLASPTTKAHASGAVVLRSTAGSDRTFPSGTVVQTDGDLTTQPLQYRTTAPSTLLDGDAEADPVDVVSVGTGTVFNVASNTIHTLVNAPFQTATVVNPDVMHSATDEELDDEAIARVVLQIQALPTGNVSALYKAAINTSLTSGARVVSAQVLEEFSDPDVSVYIDDGNGTAETTEVLTNVNELLIFSSAAGRKRARSNNWPFVSGTVQLVKSVEDTATISGSSGAWVLNLVTGGLTPSALVGLFVLDVNHVFHEVTANTTNTITVNTVASPAAGVVNILSVPLVLGTDYLLNETTGDIELVVGLSAGAALVLKTCQRYTGLIEAVQRAYEGYDGSEPVKAAGVKVKVRSPTVNLVSISISVSTDTLTPEASIQSSVRDAISSYVNGLGIGEDLVLSEIVAATMGVAGVIDCSLLSPSYNVVAGDGVLNRTNNANIAVL